MGTAAKLTARPRQQVAAVCYRLGKRGIEFLLVQTRNGRWIFPKGGAEPGLTHAQSAALEALEEAGVHGRMEEIAFARYFRKRPDLTLPAQEPPVSAHLCEVSRLERPQESNRKPTWFNAEKAKQRLTKDRPAEFASELARIVDRAVARIERLRASAHNSGDHSRRDALHQVKFEAAEIVAMYTGPRKSISLSSQRGSPQLSTTRQIPRLESSLSNITTIDAVRKAPRTAARSK